MGVPATPAGRMLRALAGRDQEDFFRWRAEVNKDAGQKHMLDSLLFEVFRELVVRRFADEPDLRAVVRFLREPRVPVFPDRRYPFLEAEALIRSALGERGLVDGISALRAAETRYHILVYLAEDLMLDHDELDDVVADAEGELL